eukprot:scaffold67864_cov54-Attheya_sp.AAC.1
MEGNNRKKAAWKAGIKLRGSHVRMFHNMIRVLYWSLHNNIIIIRSSEKLAKPTLVRNNETPWEPRQNDPYDSGSGAQ